MPWRLSLPADRPIDRHDIARLLEDAFEAYQRRRDPLSAWALTLPALHLARKPKELRAVYDRQSMIRAKLSIEEWCRAFGRERRTHDRHWAAGTARIAAALNHARNSQAVAPTNKRLTLSEAANEA
jgi:hypothetical protein